VTSKTATDPPWTHDALGIGWAREAASAAVGDRAVMASVARTRRHFMPSASDHADVPRHFIPK
jgi:hypothetical protein